MTDAVWLAGYALRGFAELIRARIAFATLKASDIPLRNLAASQTPRRRRTVSPVHIKRMAYVLPRISVRLPWRSDCLVQAIAAQNWLAASGLSGEIQIGVERPADGPFGAHAWLVHDGQIVTGGDVARYERLLGDSPVDPAIPENHADQPTSG